MRSDPGLASQTARLGRLAHAWWWLNGKRPSLIWVSIRLPKGPLRIIAFPVSILLLLLLLAVARGLLRLFPGWKAKIARHSPSTDPLEYLTLASQILWLLRRNEPFRALDLRTPEAGIRIAII